MSHILSIACGYPFDNTATLELSCRGNECMLRQYNAMCSGESSPRFAGKSLSCALEVLLWQRLLCLHVYSDLFTLMYCALLQEDCQGHC